MIVFASVSQRRFVVEPSREDQPKAPQHSAEEKPKRFRIVKLEERIAPSKGGNGTHNCPGSYGCSWGCTVGCKSFAISLCVC
jgi:hypothetical protein